MSDALRDGQEEDENEEGRYKVEASRSRHVGYLGREREVQGGLEGRGRESEGVRERVK